MNKMRILTMREKTKYQTEVTDLKDTITAQNFNRGIWPQTRRSGRKDQ